LYEPHGQWFQLIVAFIIKAGCHDVALEQEIGGVPKDIVVGSDNAIIECKSFGRGDRERSRLQRFLETGQVPTEHVDQHPEFATGVMLWPPPLGLPCEWIPTNHYRRFVTNAIEEKYRQLVNGSCNILAFNTEHISRNLDLLEAPLKDLLRDEQYINLSGFLLVEQQPLSEKDYRSRGSRFARRSRRSPESASCSSR